MFTLVVCLCVHMCMFVCAYMYVCVCICVCLCVCASSGYVDVMGVDTIDDHSPSSLPPQSRQVLELESVVTKQQKEMADLQRENLRLKERVQDRDAVIISLNEELSKAREYIAEM